MNVYRIYIEILFLIVLIVLVIIFCVSNFFRRLFKKYLSEINRIIYLLHDDINNNFEHETSELADFYDTIIQLQSTIKKREHYHNEIIKILNSAAVNIKLDKFMEDFVPKLMNATESICSAFYLLNDFTNILEIKYSAGFNKNIYREFDLNANEIITPDFKVKVIKDIPDDTIYMIKTFTGKVKPKSIMIIPVENQNKLIGVLVLVSMHNYSDEQIELIELTKHYIGIAVNNGINYEKANRLTNELRFQNKLIQDLNDELEKKLKQLSQDK